MTTTEQRELDAWIAEHVMGWSYSNFNYCDKQTGAWVRCDLPPFTIDPAAAMLVLEKCAEKLGRVQVHTNGMDEWLVDAFMTTATGEADTLPLAICLFAKELFK